MTTFQDERNNYLKLTDTMNNYNEINNLNNYLGGMNSTEKQQLTAYSNIIRSKILKLKQEYLLNDYGINEYKMRTLIINFSIVAVSATLIFVSLFRDGKITGKKLGYIALGIVIAYLIVVLSIVLSNRNRRKYDWNTYYFAVKPTA